MPRAFGGQLEDAEGLEVALGHATPLMGEGDIVPRGQDFATVGHLYRSIEHGIAHLAEKYGERHLFVGPPRAQATSKDFGWPELVAVTDLASAQRAIDTILEHGEGARGHWESAHFGQFVQILDEYRQMKADNPGFDPVRPVLPAKVRPGERDDDRTPLIGDPVTARVTDLFNVAYEILLQALQRYFAHTEENDAQLATLAEVTVALMQRVLRPLGDLITTLPVGPEHPDRTAEPSFELFYESDYLMPHRAAAWALLEERLRDAAVLCHGLRGGSAPSRESQLAPIEQSLGDIADSLAAHFRDWGATSRFADGTDASVTETAPADLEPKLGDAESGVELPEQGAHVSFEQHVRPLFRERDRKSMKFAFDLWSYDDAKQHAAAILERLREGSMPCDGAWPEEKIEAFRRWTKTRMDA